jgi:hypothetical protein
MFYFLQNAMYFISIYFCKNNTFFINYVISVSTCPGRINVNTAYMNDASRLCYVTFWEVHWVTVDLQRVYSHHLQVCLFMKECLQHQFVLLQQCFLLLLQRFVRDCVRVTSLNQCRFLSHHTISVRVTASAVHSNVRVTATIVPCLSPGMIY